MVAWSLATSLLDFVRDITGMVLELCPIYTFICLLFCRKRGLTGMKDERNETEWGGGKKSNEELQIEKIPARKEGGNWTRWKENKL